MNFTQLFTEDRAVSPVIGVILMVAITVILAAVIGTFVLGIAPDEDPAPSAQISFTDVNSTGEGNVTVVHNGGDTLDLEDITLLGDGTVLNNSINDNVDELAPGERLRVNATESGFESGDIDLVLRHDPSGGIIADSTEEAE